MARLGEARCGDPQSVIAIAWQETIWESQKCVQVEVLAVELHQSDPIDLT